MTATDVEAPRAPATLPTRPRDLVLSMCIFFVAMTVRIAPLLLGRSLTGTLAYDDGVYYSASAHLAMGVLPYRDFAFVHPPGIAVFLLPVVELARLVGDSAAMAIARVAFAAMGSLTAVLIFRCVRRYTYAGAVAGGLLYAVWRLPATTEHIVMLEPLLSLFFILGLVFLLRDPDNPAGRDLFFSGLWLGLALATKLWAAPELLVIVTYLWIRLGAGRAGVWLGGAAVGCLPLVLPFLAAAPQAFAREVVADQIGRAGPDGIREHVRRFADIAGLGGLPRVQAAMPGGAWALLVIACLVACCFYAWRLTWARLPVLVTVVACAEIAVAPVYWDHYFVFAAAAMCVVVGATSQVRVLTRSDQWLAAALLPALGLLGVSAVHHASPSQPDLSSLRAFSRAHHCTWFASASTTISAGALSRGLSHHCPDVVDSYAMVMDAGVLVAYDFTLTAKGVASLQDRYVADISSSDAIVLDDTLQRSALSARTVKFVRDHFRAAGGSGNLTFWERQPG